MRLEVFNFILSSGIFAALCGVALVGLRLITAYLEVKIAAITQSKNIDNETDITNKAEAAIKAAVSQIAQGTADRIRKEQGGNIPFALQTELKCLAMQLAMTLMGDQVYRELAQYKEDSGVEVNEWMGALIEVYVRQLKMGSSSST